MIINAANEVKTNIAKSVEFGVSNNSAQLFRMLSDFLYSQKEKAVLHEISANAVDAHKLIGKGDVPILVTAPTRLESKLRIRDYGPGLCEDDVYRLLTTYGESGTYKRDSNEYFGAFGIGSKSVAAVSNTWQITSWHAGIGKEYLVFINEHSIPSLTKVREFDCGNEIGLEVSIPINPSLSSNWTNCLADVYEHYSVRPSIHNYNVIFKSSAKSFETDDFYIKADSNSNIYGAKPKFVLSYRAYPVEINKIIGITDLQKVFVNRDAIMFKFQTGELELSLSRENLQYTQNTIEAILQKIRTSMIQMQVEFIKDVEKASDSLEYRVMAITSFKKYLGNGWSDYEGRELTAWLMKGNKFNIHNEDLDSYLLPVKYVSKLYGGSKVSAITGSFKAWKTYSVVLVQTVNDNKLKIKIRYLTKDSNFVIVVANERDTIARVKHKYGGTPDPVVLIVDENEVIPPDLHKWMIKASTLNKAPLKPRQPRALKAKVVSNLWGMYVNSFSRCNIPSDMSNCAYIEFTDARSQESIVDYKYYALCSKILKQLNHRFTVYGVKKGAPSPAGMLSLNDMAEKMFNDFIPSRIESLYASKSVKSNTFNWFKSIMKVINKNKPKFDKSSLWEKISAFSFEVQPDLLSSYKELCSILKKPEHDCSKVVTIDVLIKEIFDKCPLLPYTIDKYPPVPVELMYNYILLCEGV